MWSLLLSLVAWADPVRVDLHTTAGDVVLEVHPEWAPLGAARFLELVDAGAYDGTVFHRVIPGFVVQGGIPADKAVARKWRDAPIADDRVAVPNRQWTLSFAMAGPGTRTTQFFFNLVDNFPLDSDGFAPFAQVVAGTDVIGRLYADYGENAPMGNGVDQDDLQKKGTAWVLARFPKLDRIETARRETD